MGGKHPKTPIFNFSPPSQHQYFDLLEGRNRPSLQKVDGLLHRIVEHCLREAPEKLKLELFLSALSCKMLYILRN